MNCCIVLVVLVCVALTGCKKPPETAPAETTSAPKAVRVDDAPADAPPPPAPGTPQPEGGAGGQPPPAEETPEKITPLTEREVAMLNYAVYKFREENGRLPKNFQEMVAKKNLPRMPVTHPSEKLNYDPNTGLIKVEKAR
jgi:hypothetical protein